MYQPNSPVDELASIRAKITELRAREATLVARFIELRDAGPFTGFSGDVVVNQAAHEVFDISKLPNAVLNDARFYSLRQVTSVRIEPHEDIDSRSLFSGISESRAAKSIEHQ
jgi:hypothetical protein